jgi:hypothetical protein
MLGLAMATGLVAGLCGGCADRAESAGEPAAEVAAQSEMQPVTEPVTPPAASEGPSDLTYGDVIAYLESEGRVIGEATETYAKMMGATEGWRVDIDGHPFEICVFEVHSHEGQLAFTKVKNEGVMGFEAETYGNLAFFRSTKDPHPEFLTIVEQIRTMPEAR